VAIDLATAVVDQFLSGYTKGLDFSPCNRTLPKPIILPKIPCDSR
jgi:hypothetical protein